ncbi:MAG TPA: SOS response-associated peptidase [Acetobacteraceae bacterium]|nr:SOS response-associated peptidase [Acetobacteraceae bacterium]
MCGRFASDLPPEILARIFGTANPVPNIAPSWNLAPTQPALVVRRHPETNERHLDVLRWGLLPYFTKDAKSARRPINLRAETVASLGLCRAAFAKRRCIVPASAFYEWKSVTGGKQPYAIARADGAPLALGGVWEGWRSPEGEIERTFAIITTPPNAEAGRLHNRMPLVLEPADWPVWLGEVDGDPAALLRPAPDGTLRAWPVSSKVNSSRNNAANLLQPLD